MKNNKTVTVTGAASGIGLALCREYLNSGSHVAAMDINISPLDALLQEFPDQLKAIQLDVTNESAVNEAAQTVKIAFGEPDIWINNAGIAVLGKFETLKAEEFDKVWKVNFLGVVYGTRAALSVMSRQTPGAVVNISSVNGSVPTPYMSSYVASKHAVTGFTRSLQLETEQTMSNIRFVLVSPGFVKTPILKQDSFEFPHWLEWMVEDTSNVAKEIVSGIDAGKTEINPTLHGKLLLKINQLLPTATRKSSRMMVAKNWKELLGLAPIKK